MRTRVLVTGGAGYIGSHTCKALDRAGYEPVTVDNLVYGHADAVKWGPFEQGDLLYPAFLDRVFAKWQPALVMHFAAFAYVGESVSDPEKYYANNIQGSLSLLAAMRRANVSSFVLSSTCATYGTPETLPITEDTPQSPINPYGYTKLVIEHALRDYGRAYGLKWVAMRYFNAAGADPEGELGERHDPETHAIPLAIEAALGRGPRFKVFGTDYPTADGTALRDYIHVSDLADAHVKAVPYLLAGGQSGAFNLATGRPTSVMEILNAVEKATGRKVPYDLAERRAGDPPALYATGEKARSVLNWEPQFTQIDDTVLTAARFHMKS